MPAAARQPLKPRVDFAEVIQIGWKAVGFLEKYQDKLVSRLPAGLQEGLKADLTGLSGLVADAAEARTTAKGATAGQDTAAENAAAIITGIRGAVRKSGMPASVGKAYGVGAKVDPRLVRTVLANGAVILERAAKQPEEARAAGVLDTDLAELRTLLQSLATVDEEQERIVAAKPMTTGERNKAARRVLDAVKRVSAAGELAFARDPELRAQFDALDQGPKRTRKKAPGA